MEKTRWIEIYPYYFEIFQICPKLYEWQNLWKNKYQNWNKHIATTSVPNFSQFEELQILRPTLAKNMNEKNFEKINIKTVISI